MAPVCTAVWSLSRPKLSPGKSVKEVVGWRSLGKELLVWLFQWQKQCDYSLTWSSFLPLFLVVKFSQIMVGGCWVFKTFAMLKWNESKTLEAEDHHIIQEDARDWWRARPKVKPRGVIVLNVWRSVDNPQMYRWWQLATITKCKTHGICWSLIEALPEHIASSDGNHAVSLLLFWILLSTPLWSWPKTRPIYSRLT